MGRERKECKDRGACSIYLLGTRLRLLCCNRAHSHPHRALVPVLEREKGTSVCFGERATQPAHRLQTQPRLADGQASFQEIRPLPSYPLEPLGEAIPDGSRCADCFVLIAINIPAIR
jgi:hypothetical protein